MALGWGLVAAGMVFYLLPSFGRARRYGKRRAPLWKDASRPRWEILTTFAGIFLIIVGARHATRTENDWDAVAFGAMGLVVLGHFAMIWFHNRWIAFPSSNAEESPAP